MKRSGLPRDRHPWRCARPIGMIFDRARPIGREPGRRARPSSPLRAVVEDHRFPAIGATSALLPCRPWARDRRRRRMTTIDAVAAPRSDAGRHGSAIIAGSGRLPVDVAEGLETAGKPPFVIMLEGEASRRLGARPYEHDRRWRWKTFGGLVPLLQAATASPTSSWRAAIGRRPKLTQAQAEPRAARLGAAACCRRLPRATTAC